LLFIFYTSSLFLFFVFFFFSSRRRHTRFKCDWSSDVCSSDLRSGDSENAIAEARTALSMDPRNAEAYKFLGQGLSSSGQYAAARSEERRVGKECRLRGSPCE